MIIVKITSCLTIFLILIFVAMRVIYSNPNNAKRLIENIYVTQKINVEIVLIALFGLAFFTDLILLAISAVYLIFIR